ncbi:MAG: hypothetical protein SWY16_02345 [Cyanobacteriota bacterium]|nr:hypothetical protein [Cyanobacteriota bacterium]
MNSQYSTELDTIEQFFGTLEFSLAWIVRFGDAIGAQKAKKQPKAS